MAFLVIDVGGTKTRIAASRDLEKLEETTILDTPQDYTKALDVFMAAAQHACGKMRPAGVAVGLPALLSPDRSTIVDATNLKAWEGKPVAEDLKGRFGIPVCIENDTAMVGLGEAMYGAGRGASNLMYLTISTGVNAAHIVDGRISHENHGVSTGRQYVSMGDELLPWETLISGTAIHKKYGKHPKDLGKENPLWEKLARITAFGVHNTILHWMPERVVLGGSMFNEVGIPVERVRYHLEQIRTGYPHVSDVVHSSLGSFGGLWGGLARLKQGY